MRRKKANPYGDLTVEDAPVQIDVHKYDQRLENIEILVKEQLTKHNAELIFGFDGYFINQSKAKATRLKAMQSLKNITIMYGKNWEKSITSSDIDGIVTKIMKKYATKDGQESNTTSDLKKYLRHFIRWYFTGTHDIAAIDNVQCHKLIKNVKIKKIKDTLVRESLLTEDDRDAILEGCNGDTMWRAFIWVLWESGARPGEVLNIYLKNVTHNDIGFKIAVSGKTVARNILLVESAPALAQWLNSHPFRDNVEWPLWIQFQKGYRGRPLTHKTALQTLKNLAKQAGIRKRIYLNLFRHSEVTRMIGPLSDGQTKKRHGWSPMTRMLAKYQHIVDEDVDDALREYHGLNAKKKTKNNPHIVCQVCRTENPIDADFCYKCGRPVNTITGIKLEKTMDEKLKEMDEKLSIITRSKLENMMQYQNNPAMQSELLKSWKRIKDNN